VTCAQNGHRGHSNRRSLQRSSPLHLPCQQVFYYSRMQAHTNKLHRYSFSVACGALPEILSFPSWSLPGNSQVSWSGMFQIGKWQNGQRQCMICRSKRLHIVKYRLMLHNRVCRCVNKSFVPSTLTCLVFVIMLFISEFPSLQHQAVQTSR